jgi:nitrate reductase gamma subunit
VEQAPEKPMSGWGDNLVFGWYPYVSLAVLLGGSWLRFDGAQHVQPDGSGQLLTRRHLTCGLVFFHFGVLVLFVGHLVGLLTPISAFEAIGVSHSLKQTIANVVGGTSAAFALVGLALLLRRRLADARWRPQSWRATSQSCCCSWSNSASGLLRSRWPSQGTATVAARCRSCGGRRASRP